ncbi:hypothetical protein NONO_c74040 [Nocardia nova SH22a]|uniref:Uncharacterized protein n=1 Tax=Nocardia nova SH22a TaxID=1415166 RepID=W5TSJ9_9NOCA|nr:hypothetical protein NONO_c74040 [Nocardia nova SH22a]
MAFLWGIGYLLTFGPLAIWDMAERAIQSLS